MLTPAMATVAPKTPSSRSCGRTMTKTATALAATGDIHKDRTTEIMLGLIFVLILAMVLIGVLEARKH